MYESQDFWKIYKFDTVINKGEDIYICDMI